MTENRSGIRPTGYCVLVKQHKAARKRGNILIPETSLDREDGAVTRGEIVAMSPLAFNYAEWPDDGHPQVGAIIHFKRYSWAEVEGADKEKYWLIEDKSVQATLDPDEFGFVEDAEHADAA